MDSTLKYSIAPVKKISHIQFNVMNPELISNISVTKAMYDETGKEIQNGIFESIIYNTSTKQPLIGSVNDPRMGSINDLESVGYFGHIELAVPVYHYYYIDVILNLLKCVSYYTKKLLIDDGIIPKNYKKKKRLREIVKLCQKIKTCPVTGKLLPIYKLDSLKIIIEFPNSTKRVLRTQEVYDILKKISNNDFNKLGYNSSLLRPEWLMITVLPVPPPHVRPSIFMSLTQKCEDDLTNKLLEIVKANDSLKNAIKKHESEQVILLQENYLVYNVATFYDNKIQGQKPGQQRTGKPMKTLAQRLVSKEGRVRGNLMGKRVNFSARSVITADPNLSMDQVGVPIKIAMNITINETVTNFNKNKLQFLVNNGPDKHPGAKFVIKHIENGHSRTSKKIDLLYTKKNILLENGDIVERFLDNNDIILFNRQPSLHKMSIMAHRVYIHNDNTFKLNLSVTTPYNADFDGDEMNAHIAQSIIAVAEAEYLMSVQNMIISPQSNRPVMGIIQDSLLSTSLYTKDNNLISEHIFMNAIHDIVDKDNYKHIKSILLKYQINVLGSKFYTGRQLFSCILEPKLNYKRSSVVIERGHLLSGTIDKKIIGTSEGSIIHVMYNDFGPDETMKFMNNLQKIANYWILNNGFSIGIADTIISDIDHKYIESILDMLNNKMKDISNIKYTKHTEKVINNELNSARDKAGNYVRDIFSDDNNFKAMVQAGSKGSNLNISQVTACLGQQNIEGSRVNNLFKGRTLPHYDPSTDIGFVSKGFIKNSYITGLNAQEFFFHAMAGREGIIDTSIKTSEIGYLNRRMVKSLEDISVKYDSTVRDSYGSIIQFLYGEDGVDATYVESIDFPYTYYNDDEMCVHYKHDKSNSVLDKEYNDLMSYRDILKNLCAYREPGFMKIKDTKFQIPINIERIIINLSREIKETGDVIKLGPQEIVERVDNLLNIIEPSLLIKIHIKFSLASKKIKDILCIDYIIDEIKYKYLNSLIHPGEMCGVVSAQSMSELATQLTLNSFHSAGISDKNITSGLPRIKEILNVSKNIKGPSMTIFLKDNVNLVSSSIEYKNFKHFVKSSIFVDDDFIKNNKDINNVLTLYSMCDINYKYIIKIDLSVKVLEYSDINILQIYKQLNNYCIKKMKNIYIYPSPENKNPYILIFTDINSAFTKLDLKNLEIELYKVYISGINDIMKTFVENRSSKKIITTEGSNFPGLFENENIDVIHSYTNNILEIYKYLGIEAARNILINELRLVLSFDGSYINYKHLSLLADVMTYKGSLMAMTRHGINRNDIGTLTKSSFEETVDVLTESALYSLKDQIKGISENIILGQTVPCGTGIFDIVL